jgi:methionyl-tRNA formyltransferase
VRIVFLGSGAFAIPCLEGLLDSGHDVAAVVTQPDRRKGRGKGLAPPPLKPVAESRSLPILQPRRVREPEPQEALRRLAPDLQVVVAFGQILPRSVIDIAPLGTVNVHASLLPKLRGAAPIQWAIARGERETGVSTMLIDEGLDTGPVLLQRATPIAPDETAIELEPRLARLGADVLLETVRGLGAGTLTASPQDHRRATLAPLLKKEDGRLDWSRPATELHCRIRGFRPWPGTFSSLEGRTVKILKARPVGNVREPRRGAGAPGTLLDLTPEGLVVACGEGSRLLVTEVQPESRRPMAAAAFAAGARLHPGHVFG